MWLVKERFGTRMQIWVLGRPHLCWGEGPGATTCNWARYFPGTKECLNAQEKGFLSRNTILAGYFCFWVFTEDPLQFPTHETELACALDLPLTP